MWMRPHPVAFPSQEVAAMLRLRTVAFARLSGRVSRTLRPGEVTMSAPVPESEDFPDGHR